MWFHSFWQALYLMFHSFWQVRFESHVRLLQSSIHRTFFEDFLVDVGHWSFQGWITSPGSGAPR